MKKLFLIVILLLGLETKADWEQTSFNRFDAARDIVITDSCMYVCYETFGVFMSRDNGNTIIAIRDSLPGGVIDIEIYGTDLFASVPWHGIWKSTNNGKYWFSINDTNTNSLDVYNIFKDNGILYVSSYSKGAFKSTNEGLNWISIQSDLPFRNSTYIFIKKNILYTNGVHTGLYRSTNFGQNWNRIQTLIDTCEVVKHLVEGNDIYICSNYTGLYKSSDNGLTWDYCYTGLLEGVNCVSSSNGKIFVSNRHRTFVSNVNCMWDSISTAGINSSQPFLNTIAANSQYLFIGINGLGVWRKPISETVYINTSPEIISEYFLSQNFPNPFNPETNIKYFVPKAGFVSLKIYDVMGKVIKELVSDKKAMGNYSVIFDGSQFASGIYFYRLETNNFIETKRMMLVK